jgi:hypothetical protein
MGGGLSGDLTGGLPGSGGLAGGFPVPGGCIGGSSGLGGLTGGCSGPGGLIGGGCLPGGFSRVFIAGSLLKPSGSNGVSAAVMVVLRAMFYYLFTTL